MSEWRDRCRKLDREEPQLTPEQREMLVNIEGALAKVLESYVNAPNTATTRAAIEAHLTSVLQRVVGEHTTPIDIKFEIVSEGKDRLAIMPGNDETAKLLETLNRRLGDGQA